MEYYIVESLKKSTWQDMFSLKLSWRAVKNAVVKCVHFAIGHLFQKHERNPANLGRYGSHMT